ncbi:MAG: calcium/sodium antiporter [Flavobacteriaceae bacterium]|nr:calcium/sodium antiporter [Flavobacteriaceae bacterium]
MDYLLLLAGFVILILGGNWLLKAAVGISLKMRIPKTVIGMTVVSFATSMPELIVSLNSALNGHADIAIGNVIGSNIANLGLVLGIVIIISSVKVEKSFYKMNWPVMMLSSIIFYIFIAFDGVLQRYEGAILFALLIAFLFYILKLQKILEIDETPDDIKELTIGKGLMFLIIGGVGLWLGSELLIKGAVNLANQFGVSERIIGVTIISIGTSVPELAASIIAVIKKEKAISLGNLIGSNVFNILAVLGITSMITPITVQDSGLLTSDIIWMLVFALVIFPLVLLPIKMKLTWKEGLILLGGYVIFITLML